MRASNKRLTILSGAEQSALYELPDFDDDQRLEYLTLTDKEQAVALSRPHLSAKIYCLLQIGYFKAKKIFFHIVWEDVEEDIEFILQQYFPGQSIFNRQAITRHEHYAQCNMISLFFNYQIWSQKFDLLMREEARKIILRDINPQFIVMELLNSLQAKRIVRPGYTTLQNIISDTLNTERKRLGCLINETLHEEDKEALQKLLLKNDILSELAALKQDAKDFKARMMTTEREKLMMMSPLYQIAKILLPKLNLSQQNIHFHADLIHYYSIHELRKRLAPEQAYLYLLCYIGLRYQQLNDNLIDAFCHHLKQFELENKAKAKEAFYQHQKQEQNEQLLMKSFANCFIDENFSNDLNFGEVRKQPFKRILSEKELRDKLTVNNKPTKEMDFRWESISKLGCRFKNHLRPLAMVLDFTSTTSNSPWLNALSWFKDIFKKQESLNQQSILNCPEGTIPKRLSGYLLETDKDGKPIKLLAERYEFWIYRQLKKRFQAGEIYLEDSVKHRCLDQELVSLKDKETILQQLDIPVLRQPIEKLLDEKFSELHELWIAFNDDFKQGKLKHLRYDETTKTLHLRKSKAEKEAELQERFYAQFPLRDIGDVLLFVNERCSYLSVFTHIQPRYSKQPPDKKSLIGAIMAQALNHGNLSMAEICDIPYPISHSARHLSISHTTCCIKRCK